MIPNISVQDEHKKSLIKYQSNKFIKDPQTNMTLVRHLGIIYDITLQK